MLQRCESQTANGVAECHRYIRDAAGSETRPVRELKGFKRVTLSPGETKTLEFELGPAELGYYYEDGFAVEPGLFGVYASGSSEGGLEARLEVMP